MSEHLSLEEQKAMKRALYDSAKTVDWPTASNTDLSKYMAAGHTNQTGNGPYHADDGIYVVGYRRKRARRHAWYTAFAIILFLCVVTGIAYLATDSTFLMVAACLVAGCG